MPAAVHDTCPWGQSEEGPLPVKNRGYKAPTSSVKSLLYGGDAPDHDSRHQGKKAHQSGVSQSPFAQWNEDVSEKYPQDFTMKSKNQNITASSYKVGGGGGFDPEVYRAAAESNFNNKRAAHVRNHGGGNILQHYGQEEGIAAPAGSSDKIGFNPSGGQPRRPRPSEEYY